MEALSSQHRAGLAAGAASSPSPSTGTSAQVTAREPLVWTQLPWVFHPIASDALGAFQPCSADVLLGDTAIKEGDRRQASKLLWWAHAAAALLGSSRQVLQARAESCIQAHAESGVE